MYEAGKHLIIVWYNISLHGYALIANLVKKLGSVNHPNSLGLRVGAWRLGERAVSSLYGWRASIVTQRLSPYKIPVEVPYFGATTVYRGFRSIFNQFSLWCLDFDVLCLDEAVIFRSGTSASGGDLWRFAVDSI